MFFAQNCYGTMFFNAAFDRLPLERHKRIKALAKFFDISERTIQDYLSGKRTAPRAVCYALWHESYLGRAVTTPHSEYGCYLATARVSTLEQTIDRMTDTIAKLTDELNQAKQANMNTRHMPMNDPVYCYR